VLPLRHPHLVKVYGAGKAGPHCWVAMEYVSGESLAAVIGRIETSGMLDWRHVLRVGVYLGRALDYAHHKKLIHQSVTPVNILVGNTMAATKLADLMLAAAVEGDPTTPISAAGVPSEELSYMPPERTYGPGKLVDASADIYSLGATMYAMFTGRPPLQADTVRELVDKIRLTAPQPLGAQQLGMPEPLININQKMLAKRPEDRYQTAKDLLRHMEAFAKGHNLQI
jgi:serine/threonine protein kinase